MDFSVELLHTMEVDMTSEIQKVLKSVNVTSGADLNETVLLKLNKNPLANIVSRLVTLLEKNLNVCKSAASKIDHLKSEQIENQKRLLDIQQEKIDSVQKTVQTEMKSWSDIVKKNCATPSMNLKSVKNVVKSVVEGDARSKNFIIHGVKEDGTCESDTNDIAHDVLCVLQTSGVMPQVMATCRVGNKSNNGTVRPRPVKVTMASPDAVNMLLSRASRLKKDDSGRYSTWYLSPDRNREERAAHKKLVVELKEKISAEPKMYHRISENRIISVKKREEET